MSERSAYFWYYDGTDAKARQVADTGATIAYIKAGGDQGVVWIPGAPHGGFANSQWDDGYLAPLTNRGIVCYPWFYNWPVEADKAAVVAALAHRTAPVVVLNPETEWRVQHPASPYNTLAQANAYAEAWVRDLRTRLPAGTQIGCAPVPTWSDFPYEGFCAACDFAMPQHYWPDDVMAGGENEVEAHFRRAPQTPCIPILTACREYNDAGVLLLAKSALLHPIRGFSAWEAGNSAYQADAMKEAYALLPELHIQTEPTEAFGPFNKTLSGGFRKFYEQEPKALAYWGYPVTEEIQENGRTVQYFERARFEWHPGSDPANHDVLLGRLGAERVGVA